MQAVTFNRFAYYPPPRGGIFSRVYQGLVEFTGVYKTTLDLPILTPAFCRPWRDYFIHSVLSNTKVQGFYQSSYATLAAQERSPCVWVFC